ncbi:MAG TPA: bifunctional lysylphosphatidylglycerol synthetase/lysine--tRNA ligase LysX [Humibacillus sp.]|nr:bifunctional lysylphosphatidylglycerol synthetase/lysine--tRNA ligase LysX [Humibacillus sp.]
MVRLRRVAHAPHRSARLLTGTYAVATLVAVVLTLGGRHRPHPTPVEEFFGLLNVPVAPTVVSVVLLGITTRALLGRKRIGLWLVAAFQVLGLALGTVELLRSQLPLDEMWESRGSLGRGLDVAAALVAVAVLWWIWRTRDQFTGRLQRGSRWLALAALGVGSAVTLGVAWLLIGAVGAPRSQVRAVVATVLAALGGVSRRSLGLIPPWVIDVVATLATLTILGALLLFVASARPRSRWSPDRELSLRRLLAAHGGADSLGYFATRRDKSSVFSPDGRAAVTYRVIGGVSLASADPIGDPEAWSAAIAAWRAEAREFGWVPAAIGASERGARAYAAAAMQVLLMGDEAILDPVRFDLRRTSMSDVRHAVKRATRSGVTVQVRRQDDIAAPELVDLARCADAWRSGSVERGFSMALGRTDDPADGRVVHVTARDGEGALVGLLSFVPWGRRGLSLDLMRRAPGSPSGVTELMVSELLGRARSLGVARVSLNFCLFRGVFDEASRLGSRPLTRFNASMLGLFDRFWQLERLHRATQKYEPQWSPRFLCHDDAVALPQVVLAAGAAEGFVPWPHRRSTTGTLDAGALREASRIDETSVEAQSLTPRRSDQFRHRLDTLERLRRDGSDGYPVGAGQPSTTIASITSEVLARPTTLGVVGRVREIRDHGSVVFATLVDGAASVQLLLDATVVTRPRLDDFTTTVDSGDLIRVEATTGASRNGTPSLIVREWRMEAKSLHPIPLGAGALRDPSSRARQRSLDLLLHPDKIALLRMRSRVVASIRRMLGDEGYLEVETPMLHTVHGGASARPFRTFINAYGLDLSLRIAPELYLKRLLVAGMGPIFELGRNFRNEGADATHNPEFTSLEVYQPHGDYTSMRLLAERIVRQAARQVHGSELMPLPARDTVRTGPQAAELVDISGKWPVVPMLDAVSDAVGRTVTLETDMDVLIGLAHTHDVILRPEMGAGAVIEALYTDLVEPTTLRPTFYTDFPVETSPLTHPHRSRPGLVERWDLVIAGVEVGTAYSELTDPVDQRARLTEQSLKAAAGDVEAMEVDEDFLLALELGMPPSGGLGLGVDRLVMLLTNTAIRSVLTFPFVRPAAGRADLAEAGTWS